MELADKFSPEIIVDILKSVKNLWKIYLNYDNSIYLFFYDYSEDEIDTVCDLLLDYSIKHPDQPRFDFTYFSKEEFDNILGKPEHGFIQRAREIYSAEGL